MLCLWKLVFGKTFDLKARYSDLDEPCLGGMDLSRGRLLERGKYGGRYNPNLDLLTVHMLGDVR